MEARGACRPGASGRACHCRHSRGGGGEEEVRNRGRAIASGRARGGGGASDPAPASAAKDRPRRALRHAMGGVGRRHRPRARRLLPGPLFDRAGLVRPRRARGARRHRGAGSDRRGRMDAAPRDLDRRHGSLQGRHPERAHRRRHGSRLCRRLRGLRAVRLHRRGRRLRAARHRRARHPRRLSRAWTGAGRSRPGRRLPHAADRFDRATELLGALSLSRGGHGRVVRPRPGAAVALARRHRRCRKRALGAARHRRSSGAWPARLPHRRRLRPRGPADRLGPLVRAGCRAGRDRPGLIRRACRLSVRRDGACARHRP